MDDLTNMLSQVLSDPQSMQQIQAVASSLGLTGGGGATALPPAPEGGGGSGGEGSGADLSALTALLGGGSQSPQPAPQAPAVDQDALASLLQGLAASAPTQPQSQPQPAPAAGGVDLSALSGLVNGIAGKSQAQGGGDVAALAGLLGGGNQAAPASGGGLPFDMSTLLKLQQAMTTIGGNKANVDLLMALKPRLKEQRAKKVDDAVRVMQLIQFLPLIKESGLFGDTEGGLGGLVGGIGDGINSVLGNLFGGGGKR